MRRSHRKKITWQPLESDTSQDIPHGKELLKLSFADAETTPMTPAVTTVRRRMVDIIDPRMSTVGQNIILSRDHIGQIAHIGIEAIDGE